MAKRVTATSWEVIARDETGAIVNIDYVCPYCNYSTGDVISIGASNVDKIDSDWETDQVCVICNKPVIIECH